MPTGLHAALKTIAFATALPLTELYDPSTKSRLIYPDQAYVILFGADIGDFGLVEPDSVLTFATHRPTLWLRDPVPILPRRRSFIPSLDSIYEDE
jgi:hypothetical protein